jgi:hypothetical protein
LKQPPAQATIIERYFLWNVFSFLIITVLSICGYIFYRDFHRRFQLLQTRSAGHHRGRAVSIGIVSGLSKDAIGNKKQFTMKSLILETLLSYIYPNPIFDSIQPSSSSDAHAAALLASSSASVRETSASNKPKRHSGNSINSNNAFKPKSPGKGHAASSTTFADTSVDNTTYGTPLDSSAPLLSMIMQALSLVSSIIFHTSNNNSISAPTAKLSDVKSNSNSEPSSPHVTPRTTVAEVVTPAEASSTLVVATETTSSKSGESQDSNSDGHSTDNQSVVSDPGSKLRSSSNTAVEVKSSSVNDGPKQRALASKKAKKMEKVDQDEDASRIIEEVKAAAALADESSGEWIVATPHARSSHNSNQHGANMTKKASTATTTKSSGNGHVPSSAAASSTTTTTTTTAVTAAAIVKVNKASANRLPKATVSTTTATIKQSTPSVAVGTNSRPPVSKSSKALTNSQPASSTSVPLPLDAFPPLSATISKSSNTSRTNLSRSPSNASVDRSSSTSESARTPTQTVTSDPMTSIFPQLSLSQSSSPLRPNSNHSTVDNLLYREDVDFLSSDSTRGFFSQMQLSLSNAASSEIATAYSQFESLLSDDPISAPLYNSYDFNQPPIYERSISESSAMDVWSSYHPHPHQSPPLASSSPHVGFNQHHHEQQQQATATTSSFTGSYMSSSLATNDYDNLSIEDITGQTPVFSLSAAAPSFTPQSKYSSPAVHEVNQAFDAHHNEQGIYADLALYDSDVSGVTLSSVAFNSESFDVNGVDQLSSINNHHLMVGDSSSTGRTVTLLCQCSFLPAQKIKTVKVMVDGLAVIAMRRMFASNDTWRAVVSVPWTATTLSYSYVAQDIDNAWYEEMIQTPRSIDLLSSDLLSLHSVKKASEIEIDDRFEHAKALAAESVYGV